jgi:hypothetical protein
MVIFQLRTYRSGKEDCIIGWIDIGKIKTYISIIINQTFNGTVT